jgi:Na+/proline symporter
MLQTVLVVSLLAVVAISLLKVIFDLKRTKTSRDFFLHGESLKLDALVSTLVATNLSLGNMVFVCAILGYFYGWSAVFWVVMTIVMLVVGFVIFAPHFKAYVEARGNFGTIHDFIATSHSDRSEEQYRTKLVSSVVSCLSLFMAMVIEAHLGTKILAEILQVDQVVLLALFTVLVCAYTATSGFYTVVFTDKMQAVLMAAGVVAGAVLFSLLPGKTFSEAGYAADVGTVLSGVGWPTAVGLVVLGFFWMLATPDTWQRNASSRNIDLTKQGTYIGGALMCAWVAVFAIAGMLIKTSIEPNLSADMVQRLSQGAFPFSDLFLLSFDRFGTLATLAAAVIALALIMAAISTLDTFLIVLSHVLNLDLGLSKRGHRSLNEIEPAMDRMLLLRGRLIVLVLSFAIFAGWLAFNAAGWLADPLSLFFVTYTIQFALGMPVVAGLYPQFRSPRTVQGVIVGSAVATVAVGAWAMHNLGDETATFGLTPASWMALLPVLPILVGAAAFAIVAVHRAGSARADPRLSGG